MQICRNMASGGIYTETLELPKVPDIVVNGSGFIKWDDVSRERLVCLCVYTLSDFASNIYIIYIYMYIYQCSFPRRNLYLDVYSSASKTCNTSKT